MKPASASAFSRLKTGLLVAAAALSVAAAPAASLAEDRWEGVPQYQHILVIIEENKDYSQILDPAAAPHFADLAQTYGNATQFFGEVHPSEANYVALLGGDTFGIHDDDAFYCNAGSTRPMCDGAKEPGYADHTVHARHLGDQLSAAGLTWKGYYESLPKPGSLDTTASDPSMDNGTRKTALYASKHSGFVNFADVQDDPHRSDRLVGFDQFDRDLSADALPAFAVVVPNQCNDMHGLTGDGVPADCLGANKDALIRRGDAAVGDLVAKIQRSRAWASTDNVAIVITFDEGAGKTREGCCGMTPDAPSNFGGGHIPTIVITNHGPRHRSDPTPYNHYSLLRTIEDAFRLPDYLGHAAGAKDGVQAMKRLFANAQ
jgi:phospholipase C